MSTIEDMWLQMLLDINRGGYVTYKDDNAEIKEILNISGFIDNPLHIVSPLSVKLSKEDYIRLMRQGTFDIKGYDLKGEALADYVETLDDPNYQELDYDNDFEFVYTYPERLESMPICIRSEYFKMGHINQIDVMINRLKKNKHSNRAVATLYNCGMDKDAVEIPCLNWIQAMIRDDSLFLAVMFRSNDIYNAFPSNMYFITYIGLTILEELQNIYPNLTFEGIYYNCTSAHYYTDVCDLDTISRILDR